MFEVENFVFEVENIVFEAEQFMFGVDFFVFEFEKMFSRLLLCPGVSLGYVLLQVVSFVVVFFVSYRHSVGYCRPWNHPARMLFPCSLLSAPDHSQTIKFHRIARHFSVDLLLRLLDEIFPGKLHAAHFDLR